jgi:long-subunit fatty acid transport protein
MKSSFAICFATVLVGVTASRSAYAGGFELPDLGAQALGRGAAFTAKADDPMALHYNVAGLARQRGTHLLLGASVVLHQFDFQRAGNYGGVQGANSTNAWEGQPFPRVSSEGGPGVLPTMTLSSDFGLDRFTLSAGVFTPSTATGHAFAKTVTDAQGNIAPSPSRFDTLPAGSNLLAYPTLGAAFRVTRTLDVGISAHAAIFSTEQTALSYQDSPNTQDSKRTCVYAEHPDCTAEAFAAGSGKGFGGSVGAMLRPVPALQFGAQFRLPTTISAETPIRIVQSTKLAGPLPGEFAATTTLKLPWILRMGVRYIGMEDTFERFDLEVDATLEGWNAAQGKGITTFLPVSPGGGKNLTNVSKHNYQDTFSIRTGGAYNIPTRSVGLISLRAGAFYDSSATRGQDTRLDFDTLTKIGGTLGFGFRTGIVTINAAFAWVQSLQRTVTDGTMRINNDLNAGKEVDAKGVPFPAFNNGTYGGATQMAVLTVDFALEGLWHQKAPSWGDSRVETLAEP